jgi:hypothetical protein
MRGHRAFLVWMTTVAGLLGRLTAEGAVELFASQQVHAA